MNLYIEFGMLVIEFMAINRSIFLLVLQNDARSFL